MGKVVQTCKAKICLCCCCLVKLEKPAWLLVSGEFIHNDVDMNDWRIFDASEFCTNKASVRFGSKSSVSEKGIWRNLNQKTIQNKIYNLIPKYVWRKIEKVWLKGYSVKY